jgi:hypothetical protein
VVGAAKRREWPPLDHGRLPLLQTFCIYRELDAAFQRGKGV